MRGNSMGTGRNSDSGLRLKADDSIKYRLRAERAAKGWTLVHLADLAGVNKGTLGNYENGHCKPSSAKIKMIAAALGVSAEYLAWGKQKKSSKPRKSERFRCKDVQLVVVAGGLGTRLAEETQVKPKPMVEIGGMPILWHIVKSYAACGVREVVVCLGYLGYQIKEFYANQYLHSSDVTLDLGSGKVDYHSGKKDNLRVTLVDTGHDTMTGGRIKRAGKFIKKDRPFFFTYGDGLSDVDFAAQLDFHQSHGKYATMTCVAPPGRFGALEIDANDTVSSFIEKPRGDGNMVNGGFFVMSPDMLGYIDGDDTPLEQAPLRNLARDGQVKAWRHPGFWQPMDTLRDKNVLEQAWQDGAPWKTWED